MMPTFYECIKFNENEYEKKLFISNKNIGDIFPGKNIYIFKDRLHLPPAIFYKQNNGNIEFRFGALFDEIKKHCNDVEITVEGKNCGSAYDCLYVLSLSYQCKWKKGENGLLKFPNNPKIWYSETLAKYCDYYIVAGDVYCNLNMDTKFQPIYSNKITMSRSQKEYEYIHSKNNGTIKHILIFDNYKNYKKITSNGICGGDISHGTSSI